MEMRWKRGEFNLESAVRSAEPLEKSCEKPSLGGSDGGLERNTTIPGTTPRNGDRNVCWGRADQRTSQGDAPMGQRPLSVTGRIRYQRANNYGWCHQTYLRRDTR